MECDNPSTDPTEEFWSLLAFGPGHKSFFINFFNIYSYRIESYDAQSSYSVRIICGKGAFPQSSNQSVLYTHLILLFTAITWSHRDIVSARKTMPGRFLTAFIALTFTTAGLVMV